MKKTAVEWLIAQIKDDWFLAAFYDEFNQAKEIEKQNIIDFGNDYADQVMGGMNKRAEQYYNETFNK
jgi:hypothetical protein